MGVPVREWTDDEWLAVLAVVPPDAPVEVGEAIVAKRRNESIELPELARPIEDWLTIGCAAEAIRMGDMVEVNPANGRVRVARR